MENWRTAKLKKLAKAILTIRDEKQMLNFLRDLCTLEELEELGSRWEVVQLLVKGNSYRDIAEKTKVSTTTVTRIASWLEHGEGGYREVLKNIK